ncbi:MAG: hypothetical protein AAF391_01750 [Bacteroidota bacterium]
MAVNRIGIVITLLLFSGYLKGQVSISFENESLEQALLKIDSLTELQLSYNPQILPNGITINQSYESVTAEYILRDLLDESYQLKYISDYLIIQKAPPKKQEKVTFQIKGGIRDASTGEQLKDVSIYEVNSLKSTLSDDKGEFDLETETQYEVATFAVSKRFYRDTIIQISRQKLLEGPIEIRQEEEVEKEKRKGKPVRERVKVFTSGLARFFTSKKVLTNARNVNFVDTRPFQLSLIPSIGTNLKMSSQVRNRASINILAGYSYGVSGFEMGGLYNITREEVRGAQLGGFGNTVGGEVRGLQMAGFINTTKDYVNGVQMAGFLNIASDSVNGFEAAGFTNITKEMRGLQMAGFNNHTKKTSGLQIAGFINTSREMDGMQLAGFINTSRRVNGVQLSVINLADSVGSGIQLGIINITKKNGFLSPAFESTDFTPYQLAFRSGLEYFYSVLSVGIHPDYWNYGVGFGSRVFVSKKKALFFNPELRWITLREGKEEENENSNLVRLDLNLGYKFFKRLSISGGPALNFYYTNRLDESGLPEIDIAGNTLLDDLSGSNRYQLWVGYSLRVGF